MTIRKLTETDYAVVLELYKALDAIHVQARPDYFVPRENTYPREAYGKNITDPNYLLLGAFDNEGNLLGFADATLWNESGMVKTIKTVCLDNIYVSPDARRTGIATKLFLEVERWAKEMGAVRLDLHTWDFNQGAIAMYRSMGMTPQRYVFEKKL